MIQTTPLQKMPATGISQQSPAQAAQSVSQEESAKKPPLNVSSQPTVQKTQPVAEQAQPVPEKKSKWWLWLIIALAALIVIGAGVYFLFFRAA